MICKKFTTSDCQEWLFNGVNYNKRIWSIRAVSKRQSLQNSCNWKLISDDLHGHTACCSRVSHDHGSARAYSTASSSLAATESHLCRQSGLTMPDVYILHRARCLPESLLATWSMTVFLLTYTLQRPVSSTCDFRTISLLRFVLYHEH